MRITVQIDPPTKLEIDRLKREIKIRLNAATEKSRLWLARRLTPKNEKSSPAVS